MNQDQHINQRFWENAARQICRRVNAGFCLQRFLPVFLILSLLQGCLLLFLRKFEVSPAPLWTGYTVAQVAALLLCAWTVRSRFFALADGLVHLETRLFLYNRLTAARQGHTSWPPPREIPNSLRWSRQRLTLPPLGAAVFLLLTAWIPLDQRVVAEFRAPEEPLSWQEIESWAEILGDRDLFEEEKLAQWKEQVQELRNQPAEDWYSHRSLEAGDHLRDTAIDSIRRIQNALEKAAYPLSLVRDSLDEIPSGLQSLLQEHWMEALYQLATGSLSLSKEALSQLGEVDFNNLPSLSQEQIDRLAQMLREGRSACSATLGTCEGDGDADGERHCTICDSATCSGPGPGGIGKGPGPTDLTFAEFPTLLDSQRREAVSNQDLIRAALGEQIGVTEAEPEVDPTTQERITPAGNAVLSGDGGDAVFRSRLTPAEKRRLQLYFD